MEVTNPNRIDYDTRKHAWRLHSEAHIRMKVKRLLPAAEADGVDMLIKLTDDTTEDVAWILERWPHEGSADVFRVIRQQVEANKERRAAALAIFTNREALSTPHALVLPLRKYQLEAVAFADVTEGYVLGDDLGLGKTASAIGIMANKGGRNLVICPTHLQRQWAAQIQKFLPSAKTHIVKTVTMYSLPDHDITIMPYSKATGWALADPWDGIVFDEVQALRHNDSARYAAVRNMARQSGWRVGLSATPVFNYGAEVHSIMEVVAPGAVGKREEFLREWHANSKGAVAEPKALGTWLRSQNLMLRRTRAEVGRELPSLQNITILVDHDTNLINRLRGEFNELAERVLHAGFEESGQAARQFNMRLRQTTGIAKAHRVADFVVNMVKEEGIGKVILAGWHRAVFDIWESSFEKAGIGFRNYTGHESAAAKSGSVKDFIEDPDIKVFMMSLRSGEGLDGLQAVCSTVVFGELDWTPQIHAQLSGRAHRDGQTEGVNAYYLLSEDGSDAFISGVLGIKEEQAAGVHDPDKVVDILPAAAEMNLIKQLAKAWLKN